MGKKIPGRKKKVKRLKKVAARPSKKKKRGKSPRTAKKRKQSRSHGKSARKRKPQVAARRAVKKKRPAPKKVAARRAVKKKRPAPKKRRSKKRKYFPPVIPKSWRKLPPLSFKPTDLERMAAQIAQRIGEKIAGGGHAPDSVEAKILMALIAAEQMGRLNREFYLQAGEYDGYDSPQEVYELWIYSGA